MGTDKTAAHGGTLTATPNKLKIKKSY